VPVGSLSVDGIHPLLQGHLADDPAGLIEDHGISEVIRHWLSCSGLDAHLLPDSATETPVSVAFIEPFDG